MEQYLFNKNHITVYLSINDSKKRENEITWSKAYESKKFDNVVGDRYEIVTRKSPLGFYYNATVLHKGSAIRSYDIHYVIVTIKADNVYAYIKYPVKCHDTEIDYNSRPWDICIGDKEMKPHFIKALEASINKVFWYATIIKTWKRSKDKVFKDVFGSVDGYTTESNEVKILSHGFDPKVSFRKRKEK